MSVLRLLAFMRLNIESERKSVRRELLPNSKSFLGLTSVPGNPIGGGRVPDDYDGYSEG